MRALKPLMGPNLAKRVAGNAAGARANAARARRKPDANIAGRLRIDSFLLELSAYFAKAPADQVNKGIEEWLEKLARFIGVDCIGFWGSSSDAVWVAR